MTTRSQDKRTYALELGASDVFEPGARLPERVDAVMETVGQATWGHSIRSLKPGGVLVVSGATTGAAPPAELTRVCSSSSRSWGQRWARETSLSV